MPLFISKGNALGNCAGNKFGGTTQFTVIAAIVPWIGFSDFTQPFHAPGGSTLFNPGAGFNCECSKEASPMPRFDSISFRSVFVQFKNVLDLRFEQAGDFEGQRQTRIVFFRLNRVHSLARDTEFVGQI
jgi:hypothetical protein